MQNTFKKHTDPSLVDRTAIPEHSTILDLYVQVVLSLPKSKQNFIHCVPFLSNKSVSTSLISGKLGGPSSVVYQNNAHTSTGLHS